MESHCQRQLILFWLSARYLQLQFLWYEHRMYPASNFQLCTTMVTELLYPINCASIINSVKATCNVFCPHAQSFSHSTLETLLSKKYPGRWQETRYYQMVNNDFFSLQSFDVYGWRWNTARQYYVLKGNLPISGSICIHKHEGLTYREAVGHSKNSCIPQRSQMKSTVSNFTVYPISI